MATRVHGTIPARNIKTGRIMDVRPDMLEHPGNHWEKLSKSELDRMAEKEAVKKLEAEKNAEKLAEVVEADTIHKVEKPEDGIILTSKGEPYKTEQAARNAMSRKGLSEEEYMVLQKGEEAFIIKKV